MCGSHSDQIFSFQHFTIDDINYQLNFSIYVAIGGHCYATLIKTDIHLIAFDRLVYREIQLIAVTLMTNNRARAPELRMIIIVRPSPKSKVLNRNYSTQSKNLKACFEIAIMTC